MFESIEELGYLPRLLESELPLKNQSVPEILPSEVQALLNDDTAIVIYYGAPWCGACKIMERTTFVDEEIETALKGMYFLKIDVDKNSEMASAYSISAVPTLIVLSAIGKEMYRHVGPLSPPETLLILEQFDNDRE